MIKQKGFTLIELMIGVAIIVLLAKIAIPQYNKYVARTQVAEAYVFLSQAKQALTLYYQENGVWPDVLIPNMNLRHDALGLPRPSEYRALADYVSQLRVRPNGVVHVRFDNQLAGANALIAGKRFEMTPSISSGMITSWTCGPCCGRRAIDEIYIKSCK
jgi:type IV pilus assembly protein PilA